MDDSEAKSREQIKAFLAGSGQVRFAGQRREEAHVWVEKTLVRRYLARMTGLGRAQVTRLIAEYRRTGRVKAAAYQRKKSATRHTAADVGLWAYVDKAHQNWSGPATGRILEREHSEYGRKGL